MTLGALVDAVVSGGPTEAGLRCPEPKIAPFVVPEAPAPAWKEWPGISKPVRPPATAVRQAHSHPAGSCRADDARDRAYLPAPVGHPGRCGGIPVRPRPPGPLAIVAASALTPVWTARPGI